MKKLLIILVLILISLQGLAIDHYWKGSGNWDNSSVTNWYTDSTFLTHSLAAPTKSDNLYFTLAAGTGACNVNTATVCLGIDCHGMAGTITDGSGYNVTVWGNIYLSKTISIYSISLANTSGTMTIKSNGYSLGCSNGITRSGIGGTTQLLDGLVVGSPISITGGTLDLNGQTVSCTNLTATGSNVSGLTMGSASLTLTSSTFTFSGTNFTFTKGMSTIHFSYNGTITFTGGSKTFYNVYFEGKSAVTLAGSNTFNILKFTPATSQVDKFTTGTTQTIQSDFVVTGSSTVTVTIQSTTTTAASITSTVQLGCNNDYAQVGTSGGYVLNYTGSSTAYLGSHSTNPSSSTGWLLCSSCNCSTVAVRALDKVTQATVSKINSVIQSSAVSKVNKVIDH